MDSIKLSVTVQKNLDKKYDTAARKKIDAAVKAWVAADKKRGVKTLHVAVDDTAAMRAYGVAAVKGKVTAQKMKRAIDALWKKLDPAYLVLFGGEDIIPLFVVPNPSFDPGGDDDEDVPTDNPYACSSQFRVADRKTYLVPDRVVGRIPDMLEDGDPAWFIDHLSVASKWRSQQASVYAKPYIICCDEWKAAGADCAQYIAAPSGGLFISPPGLDTTASVRTKLSSRLHMVKCHGSPLDPKFYGQKGGSYPEALVSATLKTRIKPATVAAAMCCYGAQVFSPADPRVQPGGPWPISSTYLRQGALCFMGSTKIAWVGYRDMQCADWVVSHFLKCVLGGASTGRALLESKQDHMRWLDQQGVAPDTAEEKTMIEFVLLGDPSIHPVSSTAPAGPVPAGGHAVRAAMSPAAPALQSEERAQRRVYRTRVGSQIRGSLPSRTPSKKAEEGRASDVFAQAMRLIDGKALKAQMASMKPSAAQVQELVTPLGNATALPARPGRAIAARQGDRRSLQYYWSSRVVKNGLKLIKLVKAETDLQGTVVRASVRHSS